MEENLKFGFFHRVMIEQAVVECHHCNRILVSIEDTNTGKNNT